MAGSGCFYFGFSLLCCSFSFSLVFFLGGCWSWCISLDTPCLHLSQKWTPKIMCLWHTHTCILTDSVSHTHLCMYFYIKTCIYMYILQLMVFNLFQDAYIQMFILLILKKTGFLNNKTIVNVLKLNNKLQAKRCMRSKKLLLTRPYVPEGKYSHVQRQNGGDNIFQLWALLMRLPYTHNKDFWIKLAAFFLPE